MIVEEQIRVMLILMISGAMLGLIADFYKVLWRMLKPGKIKGSIADFFFLIFLGCLIFFLLLHINLAEMRFYVFLAIISGWSLYAYFLSKTIKNALWILLRGFSAILVRIFRVISLPFGILKNIMSGFMRKLTQRSEERKGKRKHLLSRLAGKVPFIKPSKKI